MMVLMAGAEDAARLAALDADLLGPESWSEASWVEELALPTRLCQVVQDDAGAVVGFADWLRPTADGSAELLKIAVVSDRRREGLATLLLDAGLRLVTEAGAHEVLLEVSAENRGALAFYRDHGFLTLSRRPTYYRDGSDALVMRRMLESSD